MKRFSSVVLLLVVLGFLAHAKAEDRYWIGGSGSWDDPSNWSPDGVPVGPDRVIMTNAPGDSATAYFSGDASFGFFPHPSFSIYGTGEQKMTLSLPGGSFTSLGGFTIGNNGIIHQTGGSFFSPGWNSVGAGGIYNLEAGALDFNENVFSISGVFNQIGGTVGVLHLTPDAVLVTPGGVYNLSGTGILQSAGYGPDIIYAGGVFNQNGGTAYRKFGIIVEGTYNLAAGEMHSGGEYLPALRNRIDDGTFNQSGGTAGWQNDLYVGYSPKWDGTQDQPEITHGTYNLSGGRLEANGIVVGDKFNYSGGEMVLGSDNNGSWVTGTLTNNGTTSLSGSGTRVIDGNVVNNGTFKTTNTIASYTGTFTNNGAYISDPAAQYFNDLVIGQTGYIKGGLLDFFYIGGDFKNQSVMNTFWNTSLAYLGFVDGADALHDFYLAGVDYGASLSGYSDNFSWGFLDLRDDFLNLYDGNDIAGGALYVGDIFGLQTTDYLITNITGMDGLNIYYLANLLGNRYLRGLTYNLTGGGHLIPIALASVPEPATILLLGSGLIGLAGLRRKFKK